MLSLPENKDDALSKANLALDAVNAIAKIVGPTKADSAAGAITLIRVVIATLREGFEDTISPERVRQELSKLTSGLTENDAAADAALADKFDD